MTDPELIAKRLAIIETCVRELRELARPPAIPADIREARFVEHTLQIAIQAALDTASHIVSDERLGEPRTNRELFDLLERAGWIDPVMAGTTPGHGRLPEHPRARIRHGGLGRSCRTWWSTILMSSCSSRTRCGKRMGL